MKEYMADLDRIPQLSEPENRRLIGIAQTGCIESRNKVVEGNLRLVVYLSKRYRKLARMEDLIAQGNVGLVQSVATFDLQARAKGGGYVLFSSCAGLRIRQSILRMLSRPPYKGALYIPEHLLQRLERPDPFKGASAKMACCLRSAQESISMARKKVCFDVMIYGEEPRAAIDLHELIKESKVIDERERLVLAEIAKGVAHDNVGRMLAVTKDVVYQIKKKAVGKLRAYVLA